jgi:Sec-independent protein secretion pathway component TatC
MSASINVDENVEAGQFEDGGRMSLFEHPSELRRRLVRSAVFVCVSPVVIMAAAAVLSPTGDVLNMMLFAAPMVVLYLVSILVAWLCARPRAAVPES